MLEAIFLGGRKRQHDILSSQSAFDDSLFDAIRVISSREVIPASVDWRFTK